MLSPTDAVNLEAKTSNSNETETVNDVNGTSTEKPKSSNKKSNEEEINGNANDIFEHIVSEEEALRCTLEELMKTMLIRQYDSKSPDDSLINLKCKILFEKDYTVEVVENTFTRHYPKNIIVPVGKVEIKVDKESEKEKSNDLVKQDLIEFDKNIYSQLAKDSLTARLRSRFVAPVILFDNKFICRSGTLTVRTSALYERFKPQKSALEVLCGMQHHCYNVGENGGITLRNMLGSKEQQPCFFSSLKGKDFEYALCIAFSGMVISGISTVVDVFTRPTRIPGAVYQVWDAACECARYIDLSEIYAKDVKVLDYLKIERIFDLMIEYRKHYRNAVDVSSTEKGNDLYKKFKVESMPYPGCEFFELYNAYKYAFPGLHFDWKQSDVTRTLVLTENPPQLFPRMDTQRFKGWDIHQLTLNYLKIMISYLVTGTEGVVVHCVSGWDRTPLFVSLIRFSLWADGLIHESLNPEEMAYLTLAYDWFLFGHNLPDRKKRKEEIMHFFLIIAPWIKFDDFSATRMFQELPTEKKRNRTFPEFVPERRQELLEKIREILYPCARRISLLNRPTEEEMRAKDMHS